MNFATVVLQLLFLLLKVLVFGWIQAAIRVLKAIWTRLMVCLQKEKIPSRQRKVPQQRCVPIHRPEFYQPDPLIYAQFYLMSLGMAVTWDNPDIVLEEGGVPVSSAHLKPDTDYDIVARVWNNSTDAPVVALPVRYSFLSFGIGTTSTSIGSTFVDLGVKGGPNHPAFAKIRWHTPKKAGHYCIQVYLDWADDSNPNNNLGQENTQVGSAHSPAEFTFNLRNAANEFQDFHFETDAYAVAPLAPCQDRKPDAAARRSSAFERNHREAYPVPVGWTIELQPAQLRLAPGEEVEIVARITPPAGFKGKQPINVNAFSQSGFAGGVTLYVNGA